MMRWRRNGRGGKAIHETSSATGVNRSTAHILQGRRLGRGGIRASEGGKGAVMSLSDAQRQRRSLTHVRHNIETSDGARPYLGLEEACGLPRR